MNEATAKLYELQHQVVVPKGVVQFVAEVGTQKLELWELASLLRWVADSISGEGVPMEYELGQHWDENERRKFQEGR